MDNFESVTLNMTIKDSLSPLLNRDETVLSCSSGTTFPQKLTENMIGRIVNRTDLKAIYTLTSLNPVTWTLVLDYSSGVLTKPQVENGYQPLNSNLTALSAISDGQNKIPYFVKSNEMSTITLTQLGNSLLTASNAAAVRSLLGLGSLALKDTISNADINSNTITVDKLAFTPVTTSEIFTTGDIKETSNPTVETGWVNYDYTIGNTNSSAQYKNANAQNLFKMAWSLSGVTITPSKGSSADADWSGGKVLKFPTRASLLNNCYLRIKL